MRNHTSKRFAALCLTAVALVVLAGCSADSPTAPKTPTPATGVTVDLTATDTAIRKDEPFELRASVKNNGQPVTDGTSVTFRIGSLSSGQSECNGASKLQFENNQSEIVKTTSGGIASASLRVASCVGDDESFSFAALAVAGSGRDELTITFGGSAVQPVLTSVQPSFGLWSGGYDVILTGQNLNGGQVSFIIGPPVNATKDAQTISGTSDGTQLRVLVPAAADSQIAADAVADLKITTSRGSNTFLGRFTYLREIGPTPTPTPTPPPIPVVSSVNPSQGSWIGGERVEIRGANLQNGTASFLVLGKTLAAQTQTWSADGSTLVVITPRASTFALEQDTLADIIVQTPVGASAPLLRGFTYLAADLTPEIYVVSPNAGPVEGGTRVTISGKGFQNPVQVTFTGSIGSQQAAIQAQVVSVNYNEIVCISPNVAPFQPIVPVVVDVVVTNVSNGKSATKAQGFRYGSSVFISSISPNEGQADLETLVTIFGQGFESPVRVMVGDVEAQVVSVAGTEIVARFPALPESARTCSDVGRAVEVTNINSNVKVTGPDFFYRAVRTLLTSLTVDSGTSNVILEYLPVGAVTCTTPWSSHTLTLNGSGFQQIGTNSAMWASFQGLAGEFPTTYVTSTRLTMQAPDLSAVPLQQVPCQLVSGETGVQYVDTPVTVTARNQRNSCVSSLPGGLVIRPCNTLCRLSPTITGVAPSNGPIGGGTAVTISGLNFSCTPLPTVLIGGVPASGVGCATTSITATTPPFAPAGPVSVSIQHPAGDASLSGGFTYEAAMNVTIAGAGTGTVTVGGTGGGSCSSGTCNFAIGSTPATLTAAPSGTSVFAGWSGPTCGCSGTTSPCNVSMNQNRACTATFN